MVHWSFLHPRLVPVAVAPTVRKIPGFILPLSPPPFHPFPPLIVLHVHPLFRKHLISRRTTTTWGSPTLSIAMRYLLWEAYRDPLNERWEGLRSGACLRLGAQSRHCGTP